VSKNHFLKGKQKGSVILQEMKHFKTFAQRQFRSLVKHLKKYRGSRETETLHQIRVDIKKIKAILAVINDSNKGFRAHKNFIPFREIFRGAGAIRETDVLARLLVRYQLGTINGGSIPKNEKTLMIAFESDIPRFVKTVKRRMKKLKPYVNRVSRPDFKRFLDRKKNEVKAQLYPKPKMLLLHKIRKAIKEIIYLSEADGKLKKKEAKFYDRIQSTIGDLHDKQVLLNLLKNRNDEASTTQYEIIKSECLSDKKQVLRLVINFYR
jgi:CHAD domain-containing protein